MDLEDNNQALFVKNEINMYVCCAKLLCYVQINKHIHKKIKINKINRKHLYILQ